jgi:uncharacterized lipoprotein YddW (UPF0748 family)
MHSLTRRFPGFPLLPGLLIVLCLGAMRGQAQSNEFRALWADAWGTELWTASPISQMVNDLRAGNLNAVVPQVRRRGDSFYNSS